MKLYGIVAVLGVLNFSPVSESSMASQSSVTETSKLPSTTNSPTVEQSGPPTTDNPSKTQNSQADAAVVYRPGAGTAIICELTKPLEARMTKLSASWFRTFFTKARLCCPANPGRGGTSPK